MNVLECLTTYLLRQYGHIMGRRHPWRPYLPTTDAGDDAGGRGGCSSETAPPPTFAASQMTEGTSLFTISSSGTILSVIREPRRTHRLRHKPFEFSCLAACSGVPPRTRPVAPVLL